MTRPETCVLAAAGFVGWCAVGSLLLAVNGWHSTGSVAILVVVGLTLAIAGALRAKGTYDRTGALLVLGAVVVGAVMYAPAFPYGSSDRDPGVYAYDTFAIARTGTVHIPDPLGHLPAGSTLQPVLDGQRVPGMHPESAGTALAGFFATDPALAASAYDLGGDTALHWFGPLLGMLALAAFGLAVRRAAGPLAGALTVVLLGGDMLVVWQAKTPGPELLAQAAAGAALLAAAITVETRQRAAAIAAGLATGMIWVVRPDGILAALLGLAAGVFLGATAYLVGLAVLVPLAAWQSYGLAGAYSARNGVPRPAILLAVAALAAGTALVARRRPPPERVARIAVVAGAFAYVAFLLVRQVFAPDPQPLVAGGQAKGYDEYTLSRLAQFVTWPGIALALVALWRARWVLLAPMVLGAIYLYDPRNSPDLMFWGRRFVPMVVPGLVVLAAVGLTRLRPRVLAAAFGVVALVVPYTQSWPLRAHRELHGTLPAARVAAAASDTQAVYLWVRPGAGCCEAPAYLFAGAVWLRYGKASMTVAPEDAAAQAAAAAALPQHWPVLVVGEGSAPPFVGPLTPVAHHEVTTTIWERGGLHRPTRSRDVLVAFTVWRYAPPPTA